MQQELPSYYVPKVLLDRLQFVLLSLLGETSKSPRYL